MYLTRNDWQQRLERHHSRFEAWAERRRARAGVGVKHPVYDFLFEYYSSRPSQLLRWSPGADTLLVGADHSSFPGAAEFSSTSEGLILLSSQFPEHRRRYLEWAIEYLTRVSARPTQLSCFGLHEWAMVYKTERPRYPSIPLRLSSRQIQQVCDDLSLRCTHYDAYRFFTPEARPLNSISLTREATVEHDQPGCIHVSMDLYRFAYKIAPYIEAELTGDAFELAAAAREIDMRASPYNLEEWGFEAIRIEELSGRAEYTTLQRELSQRAAPLRSQLIEVYRNLLVASATSVSLANSR